MANHRCWHCDVVAHMTRTGTLHVVDRWPGGQALVHQPFSCDECGWLQIAEVIRPANGNAWGTDATATWMETRTDLTWYPAVGFSEFFEDVPTHVADAASEAHRCYSIQAYRGAAALARAVVEASAKEKGFDSGNIYSKIEKLYDSGHIREHIKDAAHEIRHLGNEVAHGDFVDPVEAEEAEECLALMGEVLQEVFQSPARVAKAKAAREAKKAAKAAGA